MRKCGSVYRDEYKANIDLPSPTQDELQTRPRQGSHLGHKDAEKTTVEGSRTINGHTSRKERDWGVDESFCIRLGL